MRPNLDSAAGSPFSKAAIVSAFFIPLNTNFLNGIASCALSAWARKSLPDDSEPLKILSTFTTPGSGVVARKNATLSPGIFAWMENPRQTVRQTRVAPEEFCRDLVPRRCCLHVMCLLAPAARAR